MKKVVTNNKDFYNYLRSKFVDVMYSTYLQSVGIDVIQIWFPNTHDCTICGNAYNKDRLKSGAMQKNFVDIANAVTYDNTIVITPITHFMGSIMKQHFAKLQDTCERLDVQKQVINTWELGELNRPHRIQIWSKRGEYKLEPVTDHKPQERLVEYGHIGKSQNEVYYNAFYKKSDKFTRRKQRYIPEYAVFSQLYKQLIK